MVRGRLDETRASQLRSLVAGARAGATDEQVGRVLAEVVCVLTDAGRVVGASFASPSEVALIGGRRFWIYGALLEPGASEHAYVLIDPTFKALEADFDAAPGSPIGLCILVADARQRRQRPELEWRDPRALYAGYLPDATQVRIAYFKDATIAPPLKRIAAAAGSPVTSGYRIELFAEQQHVSAQDVIDLWTREAGVIPDEARRRVSELLIVATDPQQRPAAVCTSYLQLSDQLRAELWHTRVYVAEAHRRSGLAIEIAHTARDHLVERYQTGTDDRGIGVLFEVQSDILQRFFPEAIWPRTQFAFIGEDPLGAHIRVHYFPGAATPEPDDPAAKG